MDGDANSLFINKKVKIKGYFPLSFDRLRERDGISKDVIMKSMNPSANANSVFKAGEASGASGSFFFFSNDKKFIVKTMTDSELSFFRHKFAEAYFEHLKKHDESLLARIYGVYTVKIQGLTNVHLMLMGHTA